MLRSHSGYANFACQEAMRPEHTCYAEAYHTSATFLCYNALNAEGVCCEGGRAKRDSRERRDASAHTSPMCMCRDLPNLPETPRVEFGRNKPPTLPFPLALSSTP